MYSLYRSFCPFVIALKERDIFITCATQNGLNPALPGSSPPLVPTPELGRVAYLLNRLIPSSFGPGHALDLPLVQVDAATSSILSEIERLRNTNTQVKC